MKRAVAMLGVLTTGGLSFAFAGPPATPVANCQPGLRVDLALPLETAERSGEAARAHPTFPKSVARGVHA